MEVEWVEVRGKTVEIAVQAALQELGIEKAAADVEVVEEATKGTLGFGRKDAVVRVKPRQQQKKRKRRRPRKAGASGERTNDNGGQAKQGDRNRDRNRNRTDDRERSNQADSGRSRQKAQGDTAKQDEPKGRQSEPSAKELSVDRDEQGKVVSDFLEGMLEAFGLEGVVTVDVDGDTVLADVRGDQTEALVGDRAVILQSVLELTRTVVQRQTHDGVRIRLDIAGYRERRREALTIYAKRLAERVIEDNEELQLEPMNAADRKVIHDSIGEIDGVRSYSEGDDPRRFVVLGPDT